MISIEKINNFYKVSGYNIHDLINNLNLNSDVDPQLYLLLYKLENNSFLFHQFFALENFILARKAKELDYALAIYNHTHVKDLFKKEEVKEPKTIEIKNRQLKDYQRLAIENYAKYKSLLHLDGYILYMKPGMGKTTTSIATALAYSDKQVLILTPKTLLHTAWELEFQLIGIEDYAIYPQNKNIENKKFIVTNYEQINNIQSDNIDFLIIDESQNFRFANRKKIQDIYNFKIKHNIRNILLLSGTPIKGTYVEFSAAFLLLDPYFDMDAYPYFYALYSKKSIAGEEVLKERLNYYLYKLSYETVKDEFVLPKLNKITEEINLPNANEFTISYIKSELRRNAEECSKNINKQEIIAKINSMISKYGKEIKEDMNDKDIVELKIELFSLIESEKEKKELNDLFNQLIVPKLYCISKNIARTYINKLMLLIIELFKSKLKEIQNLVENGEKIVIFTQYIVIAEQLKQLFDSNLNMNAKIVTGNYSLDVRTKNIEKFKSNENGDIIIITYKAASYGLTLTEARYLYYADLPNRDADLQQAIARIHRLSQTKESYAIYLKLKSDEPTIQDRKEKILELYKHLIEELLDKPLDNYALHELYERFNKEIQITT